MVDNFLFFSAITGMYSGQPFFNQLMVIGADYVIYFSFLLTVILAIKDGKKGKRILIYTLLAIPLAVILIKLIHLFIYTDRPFIAYNFNPLIFANHDASFPSRHVTLMSAISSAHFFIKSRWTFIFLILLVWVGMSRVYSGVHYPIDVLGGVVVGLISVLLVVFASKKLARSEFS